MKVRCIRKNTRALSVSRKAIEFFNFTYDRNNSEEEKCYTSCHIGYETSVFAVVSFDGHQIYYIRDQRFGDITHAPSICFEIIDARVSKYWSIKTRYVDVAGQFHPLAPRYSKTIMAIKEWIEEPRFLEFYVDGKSREVGIMEEAANKMESEFD